MFTEATNQTEMLKERKEEKVNRFTGICKHSPRNLNLI